MILLKLNKLINECLEEKNTNEKLKLYKKIYSILPKNKKPPFPSLITGDYIDSIVYTLKHQS